MTTKEIRKTQPEQHVGRCVTRILYKDAFLLCKEFGKEDELSEIVTKKKEFTIITLTGGFCITKVFTSKHASSHRTIHTYYLHGTSKEHLQSLLSSKCGVRPRGCFIPVPQL